MLADKAELVESDRNDSAPKVALNENIDSGWVRPLMALTNNSSPNCNVQVE
jgi:hypothetical protein